MLTFEEVQWEQWQCVYRDVYVMEIDHGGKGVISIEVKLKNPMRNAAKGGSHGGLKLRPFN